MSLPIIETPKYSVTIPSSGEKVLFRPYLVKEEKVLMIAMESESPEQILRAVKDIIAACTFNKVNVETLALFDLEYIFLKLRAKSVGEVAKIGLKCESCSASNEVELNVDTVEVDQTKTLSSTVMLTDKIGVKLRYPTVEDANRLQKYSGVDAVMKTIVSCIENIFDDNKVYPAKDSTPKELEQFIESLNSEQFRKIQDFFESMPAVQHDMEFTCSSCGHHNKLTIKGLANFFG